MAAATDQQVQQYVDERVRPRCEQIRKLFMLAKDDKASIDDIYAALTQPTPTWEDNRPDAPPHLLTPSDVLAWNSFMTDFIAFVEANPQYPIILKSCVRSPELV